MHGYKSTGFNWTYYYHHQLMRWLMSLRWGKLVMLFWTSHLHPQLSDRELPVATANISWTPGPAAGVVPVLLYPNNHQRALQNMLCQTGLCNGCAGSFHVHENFSCINSLITDFMLSFTNVSSSGSLSHTLLFTGTLHLMTSLFKAQKNFLLIFLWFYDGLLLLLGKQ